MTSCWGLCSMDYDGPWRLGISHTVSTIDSEASQEEPVADSRAAQYRNPKLPKALNSEVIWLLESTEDPFYGCPCKKEEPCYLGSI